ncbi:triple QxxK/R motif-containing protein [Notothenia coriiceps]|uniref:Triple QxxK/R motif-containing protein n=1 Tax=Notothenia coriiceps TaxID=8208 RepID=A0A6I9NVJ7_9TELE|nr:PREDICTED: triple QxxK/R motif-containing protein [Notothenia coriiceps]
MPAICTMWSLTIWLPRRSKHEELSDMLSVCCPPRPSTLRENRTLVCRPNHPISQNIKTYTLNSSGKQDYKKTKLDLKLTRLKAEAKKNSSGFKDAFLVIAAIVFFVLCVYAFFYLNLSTELDLDVDVD